MENAAASHILVQGASLQNAARSFGVTLSEGDIVSVKVLKSLGSGMYAVSFRGVRIAVRSERPLSAGSVLRLRVASDGDARILLKPEPLGAVGGEPAVPDGRTPALFAEYLAGHGIVPDAVTERIVQFLLQSGAKIDRNIIAKARSVSLLFPGNEERAAEIASLLLEKGISPSEESVRSLLAVLDGSGKEGSCPENGEDHEPAGGEDSGAGFLKKLYSVLPVQKPGMLALANQLRPADARDKHWIMLPFEWHTGEKPASGLIRILLGSALQPAEKIQISCEFECKKYFFVLYLNKDKVKEVRFCSLPPLLTSCIHSEEKRLGELFCSGMNGSSVPVTYSALAFSDGLCAAQEIPLSFKSVSV